MQPYKLCCRMFAGAKSVPTHLPARTPPLGLEEHRVQQCVLSRRWGGTSRGDILSSYPFAVIHLQVEWTLGSRNEIHVLLNYETIQFSYSQGKEDMVLNVNCI